MKKILALLAIVMIGIMGLAAPASAGEHGDPPSADNKKVTFCHATSSETNPYNKITVSVSAFYNSGHIDHEGDIWAAFSYTTKGGEVVNVPAQGDQSLLAFDDCEKPKDHEKVTRPEVTYADPCGTENDVFAVSGGRGFLVGAIATSGGTQSITVTLADGFDWTDGTRDSITFDRPVFTNVDCDIPDTGAPQYATSVGVLALAGMAALGGVTLLRRRQNV